MSTTVTPTTVTAPDRLMELTFPNANLEPTTRKAKIYEATDYFRATFPMESDYEGTVFRAHIIANSAPKALKERSPFCTAEWVDKTSVRVVMHKGNPLTASFIKHLNQEAR